MNTQLAVNDLILKTQTVTSNQNTSYQKTTSKDDNSSFKDVMKNIADDKKQVSDTQDNKTYAQVVNNAKAAAIKYKSAVADAKSTDQIKGDTEKTDDASAVQNAANSVINGIAALLGIDSNSLKQLMSNLNIKPEDLLDSTKVADIVNQLSEKLELTNQQQQVLLNSVQQFSNMANENISNASQSAKNWVVVEGVAIDVTKKETGSANSNVQVSHLDEDIRQLANSIKQANTNLFDNVPQKFTSLLEQFSNQLDTKKLDNNKMDTKKDVVSDKKVDTNTTKEETVSENGKAKIIVSTKDELLAAKNTEKQSDGFTYQNSDNLNQKASIDDFVVKLNNVSSQNRVVNNELMKQVVEQAKVLVDDNRSEMVMQLKPDSLGKLTLKVVTENGIVAAKFVAENQQVKQVLEANMQTLKDSLEKQGMSVQNVSVSVGQEGSQSFGQREAFEEKRKKGGNFSVEDLSTINGVDTEAITKTNPYDVSENSIDIIA